MTKEYQNRLSKLGIDHNQPITMIFNNLLALTEFLYEESEKTEIERFKEELENLKKHPTN